MLGISYIIATHNRQQQLAKAIQSIVAESLQTAHLPIELIVVDDCSQPPVVIDDKLLEAFKGDTTLLRNISNQQVSRTRNIGLQNSQYDYILFLDDDDISYPNRSLQLFNAIHNSPHSFVTAKSVMKSGEEEKTVPAGKKMVLTPVSYLAHFAHINSIIWKKQHLLEVGGMDEKNPYFGEHIAALRLLLMGNTALQINETVTEFEYYEKGLTNQTHLHHKLTTNLRLLYQQLELEAEQQVHFKAICKKMYTQLSTVSPPTFDEYLQLLNNTISS